MRALGSFDTGEAALHRGGETLEMKQNNLETGIIPA